MKKKGETVRRRKLVQKRESDEENSLEINLSDKNEIVKLLRNPKQVVDYRALTKPSENKKPSVYNTRSQNRSSSKVTEAKKPQ